jgi:YggT family protein
MGSGYLTNPLTFVVDTIFSLYILAVMLRFLFQQVRADFYNPIAQAIVKITNPPLKPLRRIVPGVAGIDVASLLLMLALQMLSTAVIGTIVGAVPGFAPLLVLSLAQLLSLFISVFIFAIFIQVILSWVNPGAYNPATSLLYSLTEPVLRPARRLIPPLGGLDLSPLVALVALQVVKMLLLPPLEQLAATLQ